MPSISFFAK